MKLYIIKELNSQLDNPKATNMLMEVLKTRQYNFNVNYDKCLCLDKYDLISDHYILTTDSEKILATIRSVSQAKCSEYDIPLPIYDSIKNNPELHKMLESFLKENRNTIHMSYLCKNNTFENYLPNYKALDLMTWLVFQYNKISLKQISYCSTPNSKYKLSQWLKQLGPIYGTELSFVHPTIPEKHEMILIKNLSDEYINSKQEKYKSLITKVETLELEVLPKAA